MNTHIQQIAQRLRGLREALELSVGSMADKCGVTIDEYRMYETGESDIPVSFICHTAQVCGVETTALISGNNAHPVAYFVTRKGTGPTVERNKAYKYHSLAHGFRYAKAEPFEVTVVPGNELVTLNSHPGQEFNLVLEGSMQMQIAGNYIILEEGDSIYFDATRPHGMKAMNGKKVRFLAVIV